MLPSILFSLHCNNLGPQTTPLHNRQLFTNVIRMDTLAVIGYISQVLTLLILVYSIYKSDREKKIEMKAQEKTETAPSWSIAKIIKFVIPLLQSALVYFDDEPQKKVEETDVNKKETIIVRFKNFFKNLFSCKKGQKKEEKFKKKQIKQGKKIVKGCTKIGNVFKKFL